MTNQELRDQRDNAIREMDRCHIAVSDLAAQLAAEKARADQAEFDLKGTTRRADGLARELIDEKAARLKAEAAVAEMRALIQSFVRSDGHAIGCTFNGSFASGPEGDYCSCRKRHTHALSSDFGKGWLSPEDRAKVREYIEETGEHLDTICYSGTQNPKCRKCRILALLDGREAK